MTHAYTSYPTPLPSSSLWFFCQRTDPFLLAHRPQVGDSFSKHIDLAEGFDTRRYNLGIQLNDSYEGGEYVCWDDNNNEVLISKQIGTALSYHCRIWHEIKKITNGERWSIVMPIKKQHINEKINLI